MRSRPTTGPSPPRPAKSIPEPGIAADVLGAGAVPLWGRGSGAAVILFRRRSGAETVECGIYGQEEGGRARGPGARVRCGGVGLAVRRVGFSGGGGRLRPLASMWRRAWRDQGAARERRGRCRLAVVACRSELPRRGVSRQAGAPWRPHGTTMTRAGGWSREHDGGMPIGAARDGAPLPPRERGTGGLPGRDGAPPLRHEGDRGRAEAGGVVRSARRRQCPCRCRRPGGLRCGRRLSSGFRRTMRHLAGGGFW